MRTLTLCSALGLLLALASTADAQVRQGLQELNVSGSAAFQDDFSTIFLTGSYGYFIASTIEVGPTLTLTRTSFSSVAGTTSSTAGLIGGFVHVHFGRPYATTVPFVGAQVGAGIGDAEGLEFGAMGGAKFFVTPGGAITPAAFLRFDEDGNSIYGAQLGISLFL